MGLVKPRCCYIQRLHRAPHSGTTLKRVSLYLYWDYMGYNMQGFRCTLSFTCRLVLTYVGGKTPISDHGCEYKAEQNRTRKISEVLWNHSVIQSRIFGVLHILYQLHQLDNSRYRIQLHIGVCYTSSSLRRFIVPGFCFSGTTGISLHFWDRYSRISLYRGSFNRNLVTKAIVVPEI